MCNLAIDLLLSPIGGRDKAVETRQVQEETDQAHAASPDFDTHQMEGKHDAVPARQAGTALQELGSMRLSPSTISSHTGGEYGDRP